MLTALDNHEGDDVADATVRMNRHRALIVLLTKKSDLSAAEWMAKSSGRPLNRDAEREPRVAAIERRDVRAS